MNIIPHRALIALSIFALVPASQAAIITINGSTLDGGIQKDGGLLPTGDADVRVGSANNSSNDDAAAIYIFALPDLADGEAVLSASFSFTLTSITTNVPPGNADLWALDVRSSTSILASDYYQGAFNGDSNTAATAIQDDILTTSMNSGGSNQSITTDTAGSTALIDYLNTQYTAGAGNGDYVFLRINLDSTSHSNYKYYNVAMANSGKIPTLSFETGAAVPEPSMIGLWISISGLGLLCRRRLRHRHVN